MPHKPLVYGYWSSFVEMFAHESQIAAKCRLLFIIVRKKGHFDMFIGLLLDTIAVYSTL